MDIQEIKVFLTEPMREVSALLESSLQSGITLLDMTNRSLLEQGGKRLRPMLSLLAAGACGGIGADSIRFAAASELIHNSTLLHDDVVDGASMRRGKPTVMSILNGPASVLVGDFWLVKAIRCILDASRYSERVIRLFAKTLSDLAEGEMLQLQKASNGDTTREDYFRIIYSKTASLFEAAVLSGAVSADAPEEWTAALAGYARKLGLAFQIKDDIFDYAGGLLVGGLPQALAEEVRDFVRAHDGVALAWEEMVNYIDEAVFCLEELPQTAEKSYLAKLARFVGERTY